MNARPRNVRCACLGAVTLSAILFGHTAILEAAQGDCSQPVTTGASPTASDCLFILGVAVGTKACDPECICAPKGSLPATATDAMLCLQSTVGELVALQCPCEEPEEGDDFDDDKKDSNKWAEDIDFNSGRLKETDQVLEYTCKKGNKNDQSLRPWKASRCPYKSDWKLQLDLANLTEFATEKQYGSQGILVMNPTLIVGVRPA